MPLGMISRLTPSGEENLVDYIRWLGGFDFETCPFRDADALVLCMISYFDMKMLFDGSRSEIRVKELLPFLESSESKPQITGGDGGSSDIVKEACRSRRFGELIIRSHEDILQTDPPLQFAAMTFHDDKNLNFLAYRGTDSSLAGWKEDFMIAFTETDAQHMAESYAHRTLWKADKWILGGHSKGGNQVLYAAAHLTDEELEQVERIYMLDGPGFCSDIVGPEQIERIEDKVIRVIPEFDMIGQLFEPEIGVTRVVKSLNDGLGEHALASWTVDHGDLSSGTPSKRANWLMRVVNEWIGGLSQSDRKILVEELFDALGADGVKNLEEITVERFGGVLIGLSRSSEVTKKNFAELPKKLIAEGLKWDIKPLPNLTELLGIKKTVNAQDKADQEENA